MRAVSRRARGSLGAWSFLVVVALATALAGCSDALPGTPTASRDLCAKLVSLVCDADRACFPDTALDDCAATQAARCAATVQPLLDDSRLGYDDARAGAFLDSVRARSAACWATPVDPDAFAAVFTGTGTQGADCTPPRADVASLRVSAYSCADGTLCRLHLRSDGSPEGVCERRVGTACSHPLDCGAGQFCSLPGAWTPGVWGECRARRADGWACASDLECASLHCDGTCSPTPERERPLRIDHAALVRSYDPLAFVRFESARASLADVSGHDHAVTPVGRVERAAEGLSALDVGGAISLPGDNAYARLDAVHGLAGAEACTFEVWQRQGELGASRPLLTLVDGTHVGVELGSGDPGDGLFARVTEADPAPMTSPTTLTSPAGALVSGAWQHLVLTFDGTTARLYVDGARVAQSAVAGPLALGGALHVGHAPAAEPSPERSFVGSLDEVAVYAHALAPADIARLHTVGLRGELVNGFPLFRWLAE